VNRDRRLRVGVDGREFTSVAAGVRRYVRELYAAIRTVDPDVEVVAIGASPSAALPAGVEPRRALPLPTNLGWMAGSIPLAARRARLDVYHAPAYKAPLWGVHPQVVTIHDVSYERHPEWDAYRNDPVRRWFYRRGALAADRVVTDSEFSKTEIVAAYDIPPDRIDVVPLAAAPIFTPGARDRSKIPASAQHPYALHVGDLHVRRNVPTALAAVLQLRREGIPLTLVCAGVDRGEGARLTALAAGASDPAALVLTGVVDDATLVNLYRGAALFVYPSRYEGFGLPVLEAMGCGIPVAAARASSIPELVGDAGLLLPTDDLRAWTEAMRAIVQAPEVAERLKAAGIAQARTFSWERTARGMLAVLRRLAGRPS